MVRLWPSICRTWILLRTQKASSGLILHMQTCRIIIINTMNMDTIIVMTMAILNVVFSYNFLTYSPAAFPSSTQYGKITDVPSDFAARVSILQISGCRNTQLSSVSVLSHRRIHVSRCCGQYGGRQCEDREGRGR